MLDIIAAIIEELFGQSKKPPPRRRVRPGGPDGAAPDSRSMQRPVAAAPAEDTRQVTIGDMFRQMMGVEEEEAPPPPPQRREDAPVRPQPSVRPVLAAESVENRVLEGTFAVAEGVLSPLEDVASVRSGGSMASYIDRLRKDPAAVREAFVYTEIFGPPLADR